MDRLLETVFKVDKREQEGGRQNTILKQLAARGRGRGGTIFVRQKWSPPPKQGGREQEGGRQKTILKQLAARGRGRGRGGPYLSDKSGPLPPSREGGSRREGGKRPS